MKVTSDVSLVPRLRGVGTVFELLHTDKLSLIIIIIIIQSKYEFNNYRVPQVAEDVNQSNENSGTTQKEDFQYTKAGLEESSKNGKAN